MNIQLRDKEVYEILKAKFGNAEFQLIFAENEAGREMRTGKKLYQDKICPASNVIIIGLDEQRVIVPLKDNLTNLS